VELDAAYGRRKAILEPPIATTVPTRSADPHTAHYQNTASTISKSLDVGGAAFNEHVDAWDANMSGEDRAAEEETLRALDPECRDLMVRTTELRPFSLPEWEGRLGNFVDDNPGLRDHIRHKPYDPLIQPPSTEFDEMRRLLQEFNASPTTPSTYLTNNSVHEPLAGIDSADEWNPESSLDPDCPFVYEAMAMESAAGSETQEPVFTFPDDP
jgi:hypothetical protein